MKFATAFATVTPVEIQGVWMDGPGDIKLRLARWHHPDHKEYLRVARSERPDISEAEVTETIMIPSIAKCILLDWQNMQDENGVDIPYSQEMALDLLTQSRDMADQIVSMAIEGEAYHREKEAEDTKKS